MSGESDDWADFGSSNDVSAGDDSWADFEAAPPAASTDSSLETTDQVNNVVTASDSLQDDSFDAKPQMVDFPSPTVRPSLLST